jgi:hypothetical protein
MLGGDAIDHRGVGDVSGVQVPAVTEIGTTGGQIVEDDDLDPRVDTGTGDARADVAGPAGDEDLHTGHGSRWHPGARLQASHEGDR